MTIIERVRFTHNFEVEDIYADICIYNACVCCVLSYVYTIYTMKEFVMQILFFEKAWAFYSISKEEIRWWEKKRQTDSQTYT